MVPLTCPPRRSDHERGRPRAATQPCIDSTIPWLGGIDAAGFGGQIPLPFVIPIVGLAGISIFALFYMGLQLIASRMALPPHDPNVPLDQKQRTQRVIALWLPLITVLYGNVIPVGRVHLPDRVHRSTRSCSSS